MRKPIKNIYPTLNVIFSHFPVIEGIVSKKSTMFEAFLVLIIYNSESFDVIQSVATIEGEKFSEEFRKYDDFT